MAEDRMANDGAAAADGAGEERLARRWGWLAAALGVWLVGGTLLAVGALNRGDATDVGASPYHLVAYSALAALALLAVARVALAVRGGRGWRWAYPSGFGSLGAGTAVLVAYVVADVAWREGVGIGLGMEGSFAPSRILLLVGLVLVAGTALRAGIVLGSAALRWPAAISAGCVLAALASPGGFHPAVDPWIEVDATPEPQAEVWVMDPDGGRQTRLIEPEPGTGLGNPVWSPDGSRLAYVRFSEIGRGSPTGEADIWVADADGGNAHALVDGPGWQWFPRWSPDGSWVAYTEEARGGPWLESGPLGPVPGQGPQGPDFGATGGAARPEADIWVVRPDGSGRVRLTDEPGDDRAASWSPDGRRLVFDSTRDGNTELYAIDVDGTNTVRVTDAPGEDWAAAWSPDGRWIAFSSDRSGIAQVWITTPDGAAPRQLTDDAAGNLWPAWSPDGSRVAITSWRTGGSQVWDVAADGTDPRPLGRSETTTDSAWDGSWGPDGRIAFMRTAAAPVWLQPLARENLGVAALLIAAGVLAMVVVLLARTRPPFGAYALALGVATGLVAIQSEAWRFVPGAVAAGLAADLGTRYATRHPAAVAAALASAGLVLAAGLTALAGEGLAWTPSLWLGVAALAAILGWTLGRIAAPAAAPERWTRTVPAATAPTTAAVTVASPGPATGAAAPPPSMPAGGTSIDAGS